jgi:hypothetical protein
LALILHGYTFSSPSSPLAGRWRRDPPARARETPPHWSQPTCLHPPLPPTAAFTHSPRPLPPPSCLLDRNHGPGATESRPCSSTLLRPSLRRGHTACGDIAQLAAVNRPALVGSQPGAPSAASCNHPRSLPTPARDRRVRTHTCQSGLRHGPPHLLVFNSVSKVVLETCDCCIFWLSSFMNTSFHHCLCLAQDLEEEFVFPRRCSQRTLLLFRACLWIMCKQE